MAVLKNHSPAARVLYIADVSLTGPSPSTFFSLTRNTYLIYGARCNTVVFPSRSTVLAKIQIVSAVLSYCLYCTITSLGKMADDLLFHVRVMFLELILIASGLVGCFGSINIYFFNFCYCDFFSFSL